MNVCSSAKWLVSAALVVTVVATAPVANATSYFHEVTSGKATAIAAGDGTSPWILGSTADRDGNYSIYFYNGTGTGGTWELTNGSGTSIAVQYDTSFKEGYNYPLLVNSSGTCYFGLEEYNDIKWALHKV